MRISRLTKEQREYFQSMDPLMMMERLEFPGSFALAAIAEDEKSKKDIPAGLMICTIQKKDIRIDWMFVAAEYRTQGVGEALLLQVLDAAIAGGFTTVSAYFNEEYGRELICNGEEKFFRERMFYEERALPGEWVTDVKTLASQNISHKKPEEVPYIQSLQRVPVEVVKKGILSLAESEENDGLYDIVRARELFDRELSFLVLEKDRAVGGILVQHISTDYFDIQEGNIVKKTKETLYPVFWYGRNEQEERELLNAFVQAAKKKYSPDTDVHIVLTRNNQAEIMEELLPGQKINNKLLIADVQDFASRRNRMRRHQELEEELVAAGVL